MSSDPYGPILILLFLLFVEGWAAAAEEALHSASDARLQNEAEDGDAAALRVLQLGERLPRTLTALHALSRTAEVTGGAVAAVYLAKPLSDMFTGAASGAAWAAALALVILTLVLVMLIAADAVPRMVAAWHPEETAKRASGVLNALCGLLTPVTWLGDRLAKLVLRIMGMRPDDAPDEVTEDDIRLMVDVGGETGAIEEGEKEMIENIFDFNNRTAEEVMTHRTDVVALSVDDTKEEILHAILETGRSRFPVYGEDIDDILGVLYARDFLLNDHSASPKTLRQLLREAYFVPEHVQADTLFRDMQKRKVHMAIVVDEYGGVSGIVTLEDLLEEIVGNIYDEFDQQTEAEITRLGENLWRISGSAPLEDVAEALTVSLPTEEDYDTLGGLIFSQLTTIPVDGSRPEVEAAGLHICVEKLEEHRVASALVSIIRTDETGDDPEKGEQSRE